MMGGLGLHGLQVPGLDVRIAADQALGCTRRELELETRRAHVFVGRQVEGRPRKGEVVRLGRQYAARDLSLQVLNEFASPARVDALGATGQKAIAGRIGEQRIESAVDRDAYVRRILEALHSVQLDDDAVVVVFADLLIVEEIVRTAAVAVNAAERAVELVVDALLAVGTGEVVRANLAIEVHADGNRSAGCTKRKRLGGRGRIPTINLATHLRVDQRALLTVLRKQCLELLARPQVHA